MADEGNAWNQTMQDRANAQSGQVGFGESTLRGMGDVANMGINIPFQHAVSGVNGLLTKIPGVQSAENAVQGGIQSAVQSPTGQAIGGAYQNFAQNNPNAARDVGSAGSVASGVLTAMGAGGILGGIQSGASSLLAKGAISDTVKSLIASGMDADDAIAAGDAFDETGAIPDTSGAVINTKNASLIMQNALDRATDDASSLSDTMNPNEYMSGDLEGKAALVTKYQNALDALNQINGWNVSKTLSQQAISSILGGVSHAAKWLGIGGLAGAGSALFNWGLGNLGFPTVNGAINSQIGTPEASYK